ncbi:hypothetical protein SAMN04489860_1530 [Paraoerskovia marina]|uniref:TIGR01777 family protein n=2 Tax=Paraoerskovia marina TaxID=545619 RepID=A0A1H1S4I1_9CELL|nr:hypothetical protein SAMN04489860_1530 [Paraoerskovia marina]
MLLTAWVVETPYRVPMDIVIAGSRGLIGTALVDLLRAQGHQVRRLVRGSAGGRDEVPWDPARGHLDVGVLRGADAVVNLGGAGVGDKTWTAAYKRTILESRVGPTSLLASTMASMDVPPRRFLQASAVGYYGDRGSLVLTESTGPGHGFLAGVCTRWESAADPAREAGIGVAHLRTGVVLSRQGGALARLVPVLRTGLGGPLGRGDQYWPWITLADEVAAISHLVSSDVSGPVNLSAPVPVTNLELTRAIADQVHRPAVIPVPEIALRVALGEFGTTLVDSQRVVPAALEDDGFVFRHRTIEDGARWAVGR